MWSNYIKAFFEILKKISLFKKKAESAPPTSPPITITEESQVETAPPPKLKIRNQYLTNSRNRPAIRESGADFYKIRQLKCFVVHWTANKNIGADASANRNYFNQTGRFASAHYVVDDSEVVRCIPDDEVAYHVGSKHYTGFGNALTLGTKLTPNFFTIGIEMCVNADGDFLATKRNTIRLLRQLRQQHGPLPIVRHYDITGKICPQVPKNGGWALLEGEDWERFKISV